jgi:SAM-dependent methyltransferase
MRRRDDAIETTQKTYDRIAAGYSTRIDELTGGSWIGEFERGLLDRFMAMVGRPGAIILDIGCGSGRDTQYLREKGAVILGVDISRGMLREARRRLGEGILAQMDMRSPGLAGGVFDGVWANGCIYHVPKGEVAGVLEEVRRVLKARGVFSFNFKAGRGEGLEDNPRSYGGGARFFAYYTLREMKGYLERAGLEVAEVTRYPEKILGERIVQVTVRKG